MNEWIKKSIELSKSNFYLDRLLEIYPPEEISRGLRVEDISPNLRDILKTKNCNELIKELIRLKERGFKFPIEHSYIAFFDYYKDGIDKNPKTIQRICDKLVRLNYNEIKERLEAPKSASRRMGPMFQNWLKNKFNFLNSIEFENSSELVFLNGVDKSLREYAKDRLNVFFPEFTKGLDFVAKIKSKYIVGTAKFITELGGSQLNQFYEAIRFIKETKSPTNVIKVAIIDGIPWVCGDKTKVKKALYNLVEKEYCLSALLLDKFIDNFL